MKKMLATILCAIIFAVTGCSTVNYSPGPTLNTRNFKVLKAAASAERYGFKLFGIFPVITPSRSDAQADIYASVGQPLEGRSITLSNLTEERTGIYLILFSIPKITLTADVVEFTDQH